MKTFTHKIAPSLLSANFSRLDEEIESITNAGADILHLDIMDGHFVPNLTFGTPIINAISKISKLPLDAHLMVTNPDVYIEPFAELGVSYFSFHIETVLHSHRLIQKIKQRGMKVGIALNPGTSVSLITDILPDVDFVLVMSVNPGFSGQKYIENCLNKIVYLNDFRVKHGLSFEIEIDGGVCEDNIVSIIEAGADIVVAGSYVFGSSDYKCAIESLNVVAISNHLICSGDFQSPK